ncbi:hypothetical protein CB0940_07618 [Cercospora beticola]|uniref:Uncharacterized protein n=1 Tax=Cercospora beticola TaxID=122368 RepID=A0A2G5H915_CERBT|nr:hypothetical protein CB0940_07618 [Cercospora beticola]PIA89021.1 hypothetical protein CB0940_07618 [Cercospora beticola]WPB03582.1 hypothetical protein RHO25_008222 [Cercospora beticola]
MSEAKLLVYHHQPRGEPIVSKGLDTMQHSELDAALKKESGSLQLSKKAVPSGATHVEITPRDLLSKEQQGARSPKPNDDSSIASVRLPASVFLSRSTVGGYEELYIVSRKQE